VSVEKFELPALLVYEINPHERNETPTTPVRYCMTDSVRAGVGLIFLAGACQGSFMLPSKGMRNWAWENYWLVFATTAYLISPWVLALTTIPNLLQIYSGASAKTLAAVAAFGAAWGAGALTFGLGVEALGLALGFAVILGTSAVFGTILPLIIFRQKGLAPSQLILLTASLFLMIVGVFICSLAGRWKDSQRSSSQSYGRGLSLCILSGVLSSCGNLGFVYGSAITARAESMGVAAQIAPNAVWTLLTLPLFVCNAGYALYIMRRNSTGSLYREEAALRSLGLSILMGLLWMAGFAFYGMGTRRLGALGPSLGWAMLMATIVLVANGLGIVTGEWVEAPARCRRQLLAGVLVLFCAIIGLGYANGRL
jgi:L-rhamnose-H+ transport protein